MDKPLIAQTRDISQALVPSITEEQLARLRTEDDVPVLFHQGHFWMEAPRGFFQPIHWLARLSPEEASCPRRLAWGFRAPLDESALPGDCNGAVPVHLLQDVAGYSFENFSANRRYHLRRSRKRSLIVELTGPALLQSEGYAVFESAQQRTAYGSILTAAQFGAYAERHVVPGQRLVLGGLVEGKLGAYMSGFCIEGTAYIDIVHIASDALSSAVGTGLVFEFVEACRRSGSVREIVYGLHTPEDPALCTFKAGIGFPPCLIPSRVQINPVAAQFLARRHPHRFYRLHGNYLHDNPVEQSVEESEVPG
jgi:hypothetical protein